MRQFAKWATGVFAGTSLALLVAGVVGAFGGGSNTQAPAVQAKKAITSAKATISGPGGIKGKVTFTQSGTGPLSPVQVVAVIQGLTPGLHGWHVHEVGDCTAPFTTAGGHFDPGPAGVSALTNHPWHSGDLPNLKATSSIGLAVLVYLHTSRITLDNGPSGIFDGDGSAIIIHASPDTYSPTPPGPANAAGGGRVACGVLQPT